MEDLEVFETVYSTWTKPNGETELSLLAEDCEPGGEDFETGEAWFFWFCLPGCMPDSDAFGPYKTESEARAEADRMFGEEY